MTRRNLNTLKTIELGMLVMGLAAILPCGNHRARAADVPKLEWIAPIGLMPGQPAELVLEGRGLSGATDVWTSLGENAVVESLTSEEDDSNGLKLRLAPKADVSPGIGAIRVAGPNGLSNPVLFVLDDLPALANLRGAGTPSEPWELSEFGAWGGKVMSRQSRWMVIRGQPRQVVDLEIFAGRLGSKLDPWMRVLDADGDELDWQDDAPGLGTDCRMRLAMDETGQRRVELRDATHQGGEDYWFWFRVGRFPLVTGVYPSVVSSNEAIPLKPLSPADDQTTPMTVEVREQDGWTVAGARLEAGGSVSFLRVPISSWPVELESEPNDTLAEAHRVSWPVILCGRLERPGDRDYYQVRVEANQKVSFRARTRSLGLACDVWMEIRNDQGQTVARMDASEAEDGVIAHRFERAGEYGVLIEEINRGGGPTHAYGLEVTLAKPSFRLLLETNQASAVPGGTVALKTKVQRRDYSGAIQLTVEGLGEGIRLEQAEVGEKKEEATLELTLPEETASGWHFFSVRGRGMAGEEAIESVAETLPAWRTQLGEHVWVPAGWERRVVLWVASP